MGHIIIKTILLRYLLLLFGYNEMASLFRPATAVQCLPLGQHRYNTPSLSGDITLMLGHLLDKYALEAEIQRSNITNLKKTNCALTSYWLNIRIHIYNVVLGA